MSNKLITGCLVFICCWTASLAQEQDFINYINKNKKIAIREMERAGVPASIKLAQGILESDAGRSHLAKRANNHFGIKCGDDWHGREVHQKDDDFDDKGKLIESCFRVYESVEACYVAHSEFLRDPRKEFRYGFLFRLDPTDYRRWAYGLKQAGYATSATYPERLIELIERYELHQYDKMSTIDVDAPSESIVSKILRTNDVQYALATSGETVSDIASRTDIAVRRLLDYNENLKSESQQLNEGEKIFLQPKRNAYRGRQTWHKVEPGQTMLFISQQYGVRLAKLYSRNKMTEGTEPAVNTEIKLRGGKVKKTPLLRNPDELEPTEPENLPVIIPEPAKQPSSNGKITPTEPAKDPVPEKEPEFLEPIKKEESAPPAPVPQRENVPAKTDEPVIDNKIDFEEDPVGQPQTESKPQPPTPPADGVVHTVQKGDTLWNISQRYGVKVDDLKRLNNLPDNNIKLGMVLRIR